MNLAELTVNISNIQHNVNIVSKRIGSADKIIFVLKADGYGAGAVVLAKETYKFGIRHFAVARLEEAVELRKGGIMSNIIVLANPLENSFDHFFGYNIETAVTDKFTLERLIEFTNTQQKRISIHLNLNTGMNRLGVSEDEFHECMALLKNAPFIHLAGVLTHFASADEPENTFTSEQSQRFKEIYKTYKSQYPHVVFHAANSAATMESTDYYYDKVRVGITLLGYSANEIDVPHWNIRPSLSLKAKIIQIRDIPKGETIGYSQNYTTKCQLRVATVAIGYADGVHRILSNRGFLLVNGVKCPILGNISMDLITIDVSQANAHMGDDAVVFGISETSEIKLTDLAKQIYSVPYEIITQIHPRVERVYISNE